MLGRQQSLHKKRDIQHVARRGRVTHSPSFILKCASSGQKVSKFAIVISTQVSKQAIIRNKIRRQIRALLYQTGAHQTPGLDCMIICKTSSVERSFKSLSSELIESLRRARVINASN